MKKIQKTDVADGNQKGVGITDQRRTAKPRNTLLKRTAMLVAAPGTKVAAAAPDEPPASGVAEAPPKPVTGGREVVADPVAEAVDMEELNVALPR